MQQQNKWRVLGLGVGTVAVWPIWGGINLLLRRWLDPASYRAGMVVSPGIIGAIVSFAMAITTAVWFRRSYQTGERSWPLWVGGGLGLLVGGFWLFMITGEILFPH